MVERHRLAALSIAEELAAQYDPDHGWSGPDVVMEAGGDWHLEEAGSGPGLYSGSAGIALALSAAAAAGAGRQVADAARSSAGLALAGGRDALDGGALHLASGASGIAYAVAWAGVLLDDPGLTGGAGELALLTARRLAQATPDPDYLNGTAGAIPALLAARPGDPQVARCAVAAAAAIGDLAQVQLIGAAWPSPAGGGTPLLGLAHGASGAALALHAARRFAEPEVAGQLRSAADAARAYERSWFDAEAPNWPDLRGGGQPVGMVAWCHGAIGIGLARLAVHSWLPEADPDGLALLADAGAAVEAARQRAAAAAAALRAQQGTDCSVCHGLAGVLELQLAAGMLPGGDGHLRAAQRVADVIVGQRELLGRWPCGLPAPAGGIQTAEPPGLFLGKAGIALGLLRVDGWRSLPPASLPRDLPHSG